MLFENKRQEQLQRLASENDFYFFRKEKFKALPDEVKRFRIFRHKNNRRVRNMLVRREDNIDGEGRMLDFFYWDDESDPKRLTVLLFESNLLDLPEFRVRPKHFGDTLGSLFVVNQTAYDKYPEFIKRYKVQGKDKQKIQYLIKREIIEFLVQNPRWIIEGRGRFLLMYEKNIFQKREFLSFYEQGRQIVAHMLYSTSNDFV